MAAPDATSPDEDLVARIRAGDEQAFESVFRDHYDGLCRFAARIVDWVDNDNEVRQGGFRENEEVAVTVD